MAQNTDRSIEHDGKKIITARGRLLARVDKVMPWSELEQAIGGCYSKTGRGRRPYKLSVMLRIHVLQCLFNLSDPKMRQELLEIRSMRDFAGLGETDKVPHQSTILRFRHRLGKHDLGRKVLDIVNRHLARQGLDCREGTIVDATIITSPGSTKNATGTRDPEMGHTRKHGQWFFGMKFHIGVCNRYGLIHSAEGTPANVHDLRVVGRLVHGEESRCYGDSAYLGAANWVGPGREHIVWLVSPKQGQLKHMSEAERQLARRNAGIRAKVEHAFHRIKCQFNYNKVRYRGLAKNMNRLYMLATLANLLRGDGILSQSRMAAA